MQTYLTTKHSFFVGATKWIGYQKGASHQWDKTVYNSYYIYYERSYCENL